jgi:DNA processing protein
MQPDERASWLILATTEGIGPERLSALLGAFGSAGDVLRAASCGGVDEWSQRQRAETGRVPLDRPTRDLLARWPADGPARLQQIKALGLWTVTPLDADYPAPLRDLDQSPALLVGSGDRELLGWPRQVAVIGTRRPTPAGRWLAGRACARLVECGAAVVSGLALGIDGAAHAATIERGGRTVAVIGGGHGHPGPRAHSGLRRQITERGGAIVSEYAPSVRPTKGTYPRRNRIIAGLAQATIVIEAPIPSGALNTAHHALGLGRTVLVAPGRLGDWATAGSLQLLRTTPALVLAGIDEMVEDLGYLGTTVETRLGDGATLDLEPGPRAGDQARRTAALALLRGAERSVAERVCRAPAGLDAIVEDTGLAPAAVSSAVTLLMMRGWIQPVGPAYLPAGPLLG